MNDKLKALTSMIETYRELGSKVDNQELFEDYEESLKRFRQLVEVAKAIEMAKISTSYKFPLGYFEFKWMPMNMSFAESFKRESLIDIAERAVENELEVLTAVVDLHINGLKSIIELNSLIGR